MSLSPLSEPTFLVLLSLVRSPRHGYSILKQVESLSDKRVVLSTGTLYGALQRLSDAGWIQAVEAPEPAEDRRRGVSYALTDEGRDALATECDRMHSLARVGRRQLALEASR